MIISGVLFGIGIVSRCGLGRIFDYCDTKVFFKPMESCIDAVSAKTHISVDVLRCFEQGECAFIGPAYSEHKGKNDPVRNALVGKTYRPPSLKLFTVNSSSIFSPTW